MATYGLKTYKADGSTIVLQNATKSAVYGQTFALTDTGVGATRQESLQYNPGYYAYYKDFPEYTGRSIRPFQLRPGLHEWTTGILNNVPYVRWTIATYSPGSYGLSMPEFYYDNTVLYIFVK
jgi:hypothetical protein